jgi:hypothetical protein
MKAVLTKVWRSLGELQGRAFSCGKRSLLPGQSQSLAGFSFLLETAHFGLRQSLVAVGSKHVTQQQLDLTSVAQSLVQSRVSADAPRAMLIRAIVRACDDARALLRSRRTDALVAELELLRRYST